jgi:hypothetical protein
MESHQEQEAGNRQRPNLRAANSEGWTKPQGGHIPEPTYMPVVLALGLVCILWGIVTTYLISLVGLALFVVGISGWIGDLRHERRHSGTE